jgi:2-polyprenyl-6-methoxyphenol hydroxylase-like FAD-dependent oxidoreductase
MPDAILSVTHTTCCIVGGGPGGLMLALLLARRDIPVTLLEAHPTFDRDFRGDTIHPGLLEILDQLGLADRLHDLPHVKMYGPTFITPAGPFMPFDFRNLLRTRFPYIMWMPQPRFLEFLAREAGHFPSFRLVMGANVQRLVIEDGIVCGVRYRMANGWHELRAPLTVAAYGRFSRLRKEAGFRTRRTSAPVELLWFRLPRMACDPEGTGIVSPRFGPGHILLMIDRADHWQVGYFFRAGTYQKLRASGLEAMRQRIVSLEPRFADNVKALTDWHQLSLLSVASSRCLHWYRRGLLMIGDAAHTMTPAAGAGIKYAMEDAVVAANVLTEHLRAGRVQLRDLAEVQRRRIWPTRIIQALGALGLLGIGRALRSRAPMGGIPRALRIAFNLPLISRFFARMLAFGLWRVRVDNP